MMEDSVQRLVAKLTEISQAESSLYPGESQLMEARYMCSAAHWALHGVLFKIVKDHLPIAQAVDERIRTYPTVLQRSPQQIAEQMLEELDQCLPHYKERGEQEATGQGNLS